MVKLQLLTGMRPGEICILRPMDVQKRKDIWIYTPSKHKTQNHGIARQIYIGPEGQTVLSSYLLRDREKYCFSPSESEAKRQIIRNSLRKTPITCGNRPGTNKKSAPSKSPGEKYTTTSFRKAIRRACQKAEIPVWTPNQLRHSAATFIRRKFGPEAAQVILGHNNIKTTEIYADKNQMLAIEIMSEIG